MNQQWTVARFAAIFNLDQRRVSKALATLDSGREGAREVWPMVEGARAIFADLMNEQSPPRPPSESDAYWQLRHGANLARDAIKQLNVSDTARRRMIRAADTLWSDIERLLPRFED